MYLQEKYIQRVGGNEKIPVDARVLAATHRDLQTAMERKQFREDLFYRLSTLTIRVPSLREHLEDIPDLVKHYLGASSAQVAVSIPSIRVEAVNYLQHQLWPGNVRELENVLRQALVLAQDHPIGLDHVREACARRGRPAVLPQQTITGYVQDLGARAQQGTITNAHGRLIEDVEREFFTHMIALAQGNQTKAARWSGVTRTTMREKLARFGLQHAAPDQPDPLDQGN